MSTPSSCSSTESRSATRKFDEKKTIDGRPYLETTEATGDDKTFTGGPYPGSYTSPNGSAGKLHLTWQVPYAPGELKAVARRNGRTVATDVLRTAGAPHAVRLTADRKSLKADGRSLAFVTAEIVDARGVVVPDAEHLISFDVRGGSLAGLDNGREESAERYQATTRTAFHGKALAIVRAGVEPGPVKVTARVGGPADREGERPGHLGARRGDDAGRRVRARPPRPPPNYPCADASYSGRPDTLPAAMLDGDPGHRLVQRLPQGGHRPAARLRRSAARGLGVGRLGAGRDGRPGRGLLHRRRGAHTCPRPSASRCGTADGTFPPRVRRSTGPRRPTPPRRSRSPRCAAPASGSP